MTGHIRRRKIPHGHCSICGRPKLSDAPINPAHACTHSMGQTESDFGGAERYTPNMTESPRRLHQRCDVLRYKKDGVPQKHKGLSLWQCRHCLDVAPTSELYTELCEDAPPLPPNPEPEPAPVKADDPITRQLDTIRGVVLRIGALANRTGEAVGDIKNRLEELENKFETYNHQVTEVGNKAASNYEESTHAGRAIGDLQVAVEKLTKLVDKIYKEKNGSVLQLGLRIKELELLPEALENMSADMDKLWRETFGHTPARRPPNAAPSADSDNSTDDAKNGS